MEWISTGFSAPIRFTGLDVVRTLTSTRAGQCVSCVILALLPHTIGRFFQIRERWEQFHPRHDSLHRPPAPPARWYGAAYGTDVPPPADAPQNSDRLWLRMAPGEIPNNGASVGTSVIGEEAVSSGTRPDVPHIPDEIQLDERCTVRRGDRGVCVRIPALF